ncbi:MAG: nucleoside-triphosphatase [Ignisphaera sp.]|nr:nucleoside-triphosphatase [Ignisphaera sp.]MCX8168053.1 nucleoside-triphosphatase [Ignisphaera sp.]MDW8085758.1 nucleoside-triphosphatase [Ignisphaera sp.]
MDRIALVALTGRPGVGKSTVFMKIVEELSSLGYSVYGFYCPEVRERGRRIGFRIVDIASGESGWLALEASRAQQMGYWTCRRRVGRYIVIEGEAERVGLASLSRDPGERGVLGIDEVGPMELLIDRLRLEILRALETAVRGVVVVHRSLGGAEVSALLRRRGFEIVNITEVNRGYIHREIVKKFIQGRSDANLTEK